MKRPLGNTGMELFPVAYGGIVSMNDGQNESDSYVQWAIEHGVNYFDVAPSYGDAQEKLGLSLRPYRDNVYLACKTTCRDYIGAEKEFADSLRMLHTDRFDNYQMHGLNTVEEVDRAFADDGIVSFMLKMKREGYVSHLGITCHGEEAALHALSLYDFETVLFPLNWHMNLAHGYGSRIAAEVKRRGCGLLAMKGLIERAWKEGDDRSVFPKSWCKPIDIDDVKLRVAAMKYTLSLGADIIVPPGDFVNFSFAVEHIGECIANPLSEDELAYLRGECERVRAYPFFDV